MAEIRRCMNAIKDERVQLERERLQIIDVALAMGFSCVFPKKPFTVEESEFRTATGFLVRCLMTDV